MRRFFTMILGVFLGGGLVYFAFHFYLVRTADSVLVVRKRQPAISEFVVDIRSWTFRNWQEHPQLAADLVEEGHGDLVERGMGQRLIHDFLGKLGARSVFESKPSPKPEKMRD